MQENNEHLLPHMDREGLEFFKDRVASSKCYLEYGCGGSTVYVCKTAKVGAVLSVDTDKTWVERVRSVLDGAGGNLYLDHIDLGETGPWGAPRTRDRFRDFWKYSVSPWENAKSRGLVPDTVFIDGRFRISCFLYSLISARVGTVIMFDDYVNRPKYFVMEEFCKLERAVGRVGVFVVSNQFDVRGLMAMYGKYSVDWA